MKSDFFIDRPVFSIVISIIIVLVGLIGLVMLPVDQYPQIVPPVVKISASYPGASAQTVAQAVATPIEQELNGTPGMLYMESTNTNSGSFSATLTFDISSDPDLAAVEVQNRVKLAESRLPAEVVQNGISVEKEAASRLMTITVLSDDPKFDEIYLSNYTTLNVLDMLRRVPGVGRVSNVGSRYYGMQIWVQPDKLASLGLTVDDLTSALKDQNRESAAGVLGQQPISGVDVTIPITATGRLSTVSQFENIVVRTGEDGAIIRIKDVARVSLEAQSYNTESGINGGNAAMMYVYTLPGANAMKVAEDVKATMEEISKNFPDGITYDIPFDMTTYISESIHHVYKTLFEALFLVILVVFLSLQSWRATVIPAIAVPISLVGTFGIMLAFGFSLNMMTLLGLILAIGIVVDDAIVVVENVDRIMEEENLPPYEATKKAMSGIGGALIAMSLVLCAVFVPVSFLSGITGQLFRQFTITIAVSVIISTVVALTLSPVMCSRILKPHDANERKNFLFRKINQGFATGNSFYEKIIHASLRHSPRMFALFGVTIVCIWALGQLVPKSFMPQEDQGYFTVELELPVGATLERTRAVTERAMDFLLRQSDIEYVLNVTGSSPRIGTSQSNSTLTVIMKPWKERKERDINKMMQKVRDTLSLYPESKVYLSSPAVIPGLGTSGGFSMVLEARGDATYEDLQAAADTLLFYASQKKELTGLASGMQKNIPQLYFDADRDKIQLLGVPLSDVFFAEGANIATVYSDGTLRYVSESDLTISSSPQAERAQIGGDYTVTATLTGTDASAGVHVTAGNTVTADNAYAVEITGGRLTTENGRTFAGNFNTNNMPENSIEFMLDMPEAATVDLVISMSNGYLTKTPDDMYQMSELPLADIMDATLNGDTDIDLSGISLPETGESSNSGELYGNFVEITLKGIALDAGENTLVLSLHRSESGLQTCWGNSNADGDEGDDLPNESPVVNVEYVTVVTEDPETDV